MNREKTYVPREYFWRNRILVPAALRIFGIPLVKLKGAECRRYHPKHKTFLLIANHNETLDPAYEMVSLMRYVRYVSSDHVVRAGFKGWFFNYFGTPIIKYRSRPGRELTEAILSTLRAGVSVGIHAEGGMSYNGESRYISPNTAKLIKDAGCAVITYRSTGGYLRSPRWKRHHRKGPLLGEVVREYGREEIQNMSQEEVYEAICRDLHVNAYEQQRRVPKEYTGDALAECCEIVLYRCPVCKQIGTMHSKGDILSCECGYSVRMRTDGFFHSCGPEVVFDNIRDWEHWQRKSVREYLESFKDRSEVPVFGDEEQILVKVEGEKEIPISKKAVMELYYDRMEICWENGKWIAPLSAIKKMDYVKWQSLLVVTETDYFDVSSRIPRSATKYMDAWRYLTGRPNY